MTNGELSTIQAAQWLSKRPLGARASAPAVDSRYPAEGFYLAHNERGVLAFEGSMSIRHDWTVYNERGRRARFKLTVSEKAKGYQR